MERNTNVTKLCLNKDACSVKSVSCDSLVSVTSTCYLDIAYRGIINELKRYSTTEKYISIKLGYANIFIVPTHLFQ